MDSNDLMSQSSRDNSSTLMTSLRNPSPFSFPLVLWIHLSKLLQTRMASQPKKIVVVTGALGLQGGAVVRFLLNNGRYAVRALTRSPDSEGGKCELSWHSYIDAVFLWILDLKSPCGRVFEACLQRCIWCLRRDEWWEASLIVVYKLTEPFLTNERLETWGQVWRSWARQKPRWRCSSYWHPTFRLGVVPSWW